MANKALLFWCAGSVLICGTAALATTSLWRAPAPSTGIAAPADGVVTSGNLTEPALAVAPAMPVAETFSPSDGFLSLAETSFFEPRAAGASSLFRGALPPEPATAPPADVAVAPAPDAIETPAAEAAPAFAEVVPQAIPTGPAIDVLPPPRPKFQLARLEAGGKATIGEIQPGQPAPGFETPAPVPQGQPGWNWNDAFRAPRQAAQPERVIHAGIASWYGPGFHGRKTASGERFDQNDMTAAHRTLPFGSRVKVVDEKTGRSIVVRINDRGPFSHGRVIDLSKQAAQALGMGGLARVKLVSAN